MFSAFPRCWILGAVRRTLSLGAVSLWTGTQTGEARTGSPRWLGFLPVSCDFLMASTQSAALVFSLTEKRLIEPKRSSLKFKFKSASPAHVQALIMCRGAAAVFCREDERQQQEVDCWHNDFIHTSLSCFFFFSCSPSLRKSRMHRAKSYPDNRQEFSGEACAEFQTERERNPS